MTRGREVRVAVIGCGHWGRNLVRCFHESGVLAALCDSESAVADQMGQQFGVPALGLHEIMRDKAITAVAIAAPAALHYGLARQALSVGKHVFVEKPIALSVSEGEALRSLADGTGLTLMVGHLLHYHPAYRRLQELVAEGRLGELRYLYSNRLSMGMLRTEEDVLWSFAPHDISMILGLVGAEPIHVESRGTVAVSDGLVDIAHIHMTFASRIGAHVHASWLHPFKERRLVVIGERACAVFDDEAPWPLKLVLTPYSIDDGPALQKGAAEPVELEPGEPLKAEAEHFIDCVRHGRSPRTDAQEALRAVRVLARASSALKAEAA